MWKYGKRKNPTMTLVTCVHITISKEEYLKMVDVHKYCFDTGLMEKSLRYELVCKSPIKKMACGKRLMKKNMRYKLVCKIPTNKMEYVRQTPQS